MQHFSKKFERIGASRSIPELPRSFPDVLQFGGQPTPPTKRPFLEPAAPHGLKAGRSPRHGLRGRQLAEGHRRPLPQGTPGAPERGRESLRAAAAAEAALAREGRGREVHGFAQPLEPK